MYISIPSIFKLKKILLSKSQAIIYNIGFHICNITQLRVDFLLILTCLFLFLHKAIILL